jgi:hypothetical protein
MCSSRREFLFNSAAGLGLGMISRPVSAAEARGAQLDCSTDFSRVFLRFLHKSLSAVTRAACRSRACGRVDRRISPYVMSHMAGSYLDAPLLQRIVSG